MELAVVKEGQVDILVPAETLKTIGPYIGGSH